MRIVLLGAPGSGKGTQAELLAERYKIPYFSSGDLLRESVASGSAPGRQAKLAMDAGQLVGDDILLGIIQERILRSDARNGFILDGFPRSLPQAEALDQLFDGLGRPLHLALLLAVDVDALLQRLVGRRTCLSCGQIYNVFYSPPRIDGRCDECGGRLRHRADDNEETIGNRLRVYELHTLPVIEYYKAQGKLRTVQGVGDISAIFKAMCKVVEDVKTHTDTGKRSDAIRRAIARQQLPAAARDKSKKAAPVKTAPARAASRKAAPEKAVASKATAGKAVSAKASPKKAPPKKAVPKKAASAKAAPKKATPKKAVPKKAATKKAVPKKAAPKAAPRKAAAGKPAAGKPAAKKKATRAATAGKSPAAKASARKAVSGKSAGKKPGSRKSTAR
jgi:adenylate kinase